ncbi:hypothetical protein [Apilactobacillus timberlakei]|uniref:Uracil-DNA glycosylase-like domain-containing protein n=1 Tax=Apilactobacillus timberlakei TaxID=2008380 RepID=A0ABY2YUN7_9LACO|nr:hypothetical protein [Apilactobacillus timberlakei]TPR15774.1 hypothetical protein DY052_04130 [Apilactobacillus timberlakei]TPR16135.1 hypothetical protein DY048_01345 [Apilactobacillus timberlakei]
MKKKDFKKQKDFINYTKEHKFDKMCTFLTYPLYEKKLKDTDSNKKVKNISSYVELTNETINSSDYFLEKMQIKNGIVFLGLNEASIGTQIDENHNSFQTMHKYIRALNEKRNTSKDYAIAKLVHNVKAVEGSFAFDIINGIQITHMPELNSVIKKMNKNKFEIKKNKENFIGLPIKNNNTNNLYKHIKDYDIPIFYKLMRKLDPKVVICFGNNSNSLANTFNQLCDLNLNIFKMDHYSYTGNAKKYGNEDERRKNQVINILNN